MLPQANQSGQDQHTQQQSGTSRPGMQEAEPAVGIPAAGTEGQVDPQENGSDLPKTARSGDSPAKSPADLWLLALRCSKCHAYLVVGVSGPVKVNILHASNLGCM
jgi:hypothetical protein